MHTIKNLTNSPYDIRLEGGKVERLPARGEITVDVDPMHLPLYRTLGYFEISEGQAASNAGDDDIDRLRAEYTELVGKKPYIGWDVAELQKRIDKALEA